MTTLFCRRVRLLIGLAGVLLLAASAGCNDRPGLRPEALARLDAEQSSGPFTATPIFAPPLDSPAGATEQPPVMLPIETFSWRPVWLAVSGASLGETTYYREWYYDDQGRTGWGWGRGGGYFSRTFESYRTGAIVK